MELADIAGAVATYAIRAVLEFVAVMIVAFLFLLRMAHYFNRQRRELAQADLDKIDKMGWRTFESYVRVLFERLGYEVEETGLFDEGPFDKGADLILVKGEGRTAVQVKMRRHKKGDNTVNVDAVGAVLRSMAPYKCNRAMVVTNGYYTGPAKRAAKDSGVTLWDRNDLAQILLFLDKKGDQVPVPSVLAWIFGGPRRATISFLPDAIGGRKELCATCGKYLTWGVIKYCLDQPDRFGGKVYCMEHQEIFRARKQTPRANSTLRPEQPGEYIQ